MHDNTLFVEFINTTTFAVVAKPIFLTYSQGCALYQWKKLACRLCGMLYPTDSMTICGILLSIVKETLESEGIYRGSVRVLSLLFCVASYGRCASVNCRCCVTL